MSNYTKLTDFAAKDSLPSGNAAKIVKGTEIDDEFGAIQDAIATKADLLSPEFSGVPKVPTADFGTNNTTAASTAFVQSALQAVYPVGSIYISTSATNPSTTFGFGTWEAFGAGRVLVGQDTGDTSFDTLEETGGSKNAVVVSHTHSVTDPGHGHTLDGTTGRQDTWNESLSGGRVAGEDTGTIGAYSGLVNNATTGISIASAGESGTNKNLQPYVVVKMWKRTA